MILFLFNSCGIGITVSVPKHYPPTDEDKLEMIYLNQDLPKGLQRIGSITVGDGGFTLAYNCTYEACLMTIQQEAAKVGADVACIVLVKEPTSIFHIGNGGTSHGGTECYTVTADLYKRK